MDWLMVFSLRSRELWAAVKLRSGKPEGREGREGAQNSRPLKTKTH